MEESKEVKQTQEKKNEIDFMDLISKGVIMTVINGEPGVILFNSNISDSMIYWMGKDTGNGEGDDFLFSISGFFLDLYDYYIMSINPDDTNSILKLKEAIAAAISSINRDVQNVPKDYKYNFKDLEEAANFFFEAEESEEIEKG